MTTTAFKANTLLENEGKKIQATFNTLTEDLRDGLAAYWDIAGEILDDSSITLCKPTSDYFAIERNFFSALFLYSYLRANIPTKRRRLYVAVNQCLRGMVTGCDNILDDEYKHTLETSLPGQAWRFRSVLDIMVSDRVLFTLLQREKDLTADQVREASYASLRALTRSGTQEASEEGGAGERLKPETVLKKVHHDKTGILFQCPWALPEVLEAGLSETIPTLKTALYNIGMGCQIFDDMMDLSRDILMDRHNYMASVLWHETGLDGRAKLAEKMAGQTLENLSISANQDLLLAFPDVLARAAKTAEQFLQNGTRALFREDHHFMIDHTIAFVRARIGVDSFLG